jgi:hypothetical protein
VPCSIKLVLFCSSLPFEYKGSAAAKRGRFTKMSQSMRID